MSAILNNIRLVFYYIFGTGGTNVDFAAGDLGTGSAAINDLNITFGDSLAGGVVNAVTSNPILLIFCIFSLALIGISVFKRLTSN